MVPLYNNRIVTKGGKIIVPLTQTAKDIIGIIQDDASLNLSKNEVFYTNFTVGNLIEQGLWDKIKALYGFVGGTAATHRWNWKDMRDLNSAFRLSFLGGGWIHSNAGIKPNGVSDYANTFFNAASNLSMANNHIALYNRTSTFVSPSEFEIGAADNDTLSANYFTLSALRNDNTAGFGSSSSLLLPYLVINSTSTKMTIGNFFDSTQSMFKNSVKITTNINNIVYGNTLPNLNVFIGAYNFKSAPRFYSNKEFQFASIGNGLTDQEAIQMSHIITTAQGILGRK